MALDQTAQPTTSRLTPMEVTPMQLTVLDRTDEQDAVAALSAMTGLSALSGRVVAEQLPCRVNDPELFFAESPADVEYAKTLCATCPARQDCLNGALERREPWGVWGGEWFVQGVVVPRKRPRGRPRKSEVAA
jgi:WhiB family redox-sensing transcriptional regulator